jgi:hypothetical protein
MAGEHVQAVHKLQELEEIRQLKARYCRFLDTKDVESWRAVFTTDVVVTLDMAVSVGGADPKTAPPLQGINNFVPMVMGGLENVATKHHCHTLELALVSATTATGIWAMEDLLVFGFHLCGTASCSAPATTTRHTKSGTVHGGSRACT